MHTTDSRYMNALLDFTGSDTNFSLHYRAASTPGLLLPPFHANWSTFNLAEPAMRMLLVSECVNATSAGGGPFDGCFIDRANYGREMLAVYRQTGHTPPLLTPTDVEGLSAGGDALLAEVQAAVGPALVVAKMHGDLAGWGPASTNAYMFNDGLCSRYDKVNRAAGGWLDGPGCLDQMQAVLAATARGATVQCRAMGPTTGPDGQGNLTFTLAAFLAVAGNMSYFSYASNGHDSYELGFTMWPSEFDRPLGPPTGPAVRSGPNGSVFHRKFASGTAVVVDALRGTANIDWAR